MVSLVRVGTAFSTSLQRDNLTEYSRLSHLNQIFLIQKVKIFSTHLGSWSLGGNLSGSASLQEGRHLVLLYVLCKILRGLPILVLSLYIRLGVHQDLGDLPEASKIFSDQTENYFLLTGSCSAVERGLTVPVGQINVRSLLDESLDDVDLQTDNISLTQRGSCSSPC